MNKPSIFLLTRMPFEDQSKRVIRLCIPGIDKGGAVWLEAEIEGDEEYVRKVLSGCQDSLKDGVMSDTD